PSASCAHRAAGLSGGKAGAGRGPDPREGWSPASITVSAGAGSCVSPSLPGPGLFDEVAAQGLGDGSGSVGGAELLEDMLEVGLNRVGRDEELVGDVLVGMTEGEELQDLDLAGREGLRLAVALLG